jgi:hypothetical protein
MLGKQSGLHAHPNAAVVLETGQLRIFRDNPGLEIGQADQTQDFSHPVPELNPLAMLDGWRRYGC